MKVKSQPEPVKLVDQVGVAERGYVSWKRGKIETGLQQSKNRDAMISADKVWHELGLER
jgi:hypothetical protein